MRRQPISLAPAIVSAALLAPTATAAMTGICASVHRNAGHTLVDLYATMGAQQDLLQFVALRTLTTTAAGGFVQGTNPALKGWAPDANFTSTRDSLDSFLTIGGSQYGNPAGPYYANLSLFPSPWPTGTWTGTPLSAPSTSIVSDTTISWSVIGTDNKARGIDISGIEGRMNVLGNAAGSNLGVWFAHLVIEGDAPFNVTFGTLGAWYQNGPSSYSQPYIDGGNLSFTVLPAPGAMASLLAAAALRHRRRA